MPKDSTKPYSPSTLETLLAGLAAGISNFGRPGSGGQVLETFQQGINQENQSRAHQLLASLLSRPQVQGPPAPYQSAEVSAPMIGGGQISGMQNVLGSFPPTISPEDEANFYQQGLAQYGGQGGDVGQALQILEALGKVQTPLTKYQTAQLDMASKKADYQRTKDQKGLELRQRALDIQESAAKSLERYRNPNKPLTPKDKLSYVNSLRQQMTSYNRSAVLHNSNITTIPTENGALTLGGQPLPIFTSVEEFAKSIGEDERLAEFNKTISPSIQTKPKSQADKFDEALKKKK